MANDFSGIFTPLITPIDPEGRPDVDSIRRLVDFQIASGVHGLWVLGTSGEFAAFSEHERATVLEASVEAANARVPVIVNVSDAATRLVLGHARRALAAGADAIAATPPYYYPHSQDELLAHYRSIREAIDVPLFIYNIPQTVRVAVSLDTAKTLAKEAVVAGIKDSQNNLEWFRTLALYTSDLGLDFALFCGTRHLIDAGILAGAHGAIPSIANAFPVLAVATYEASVQGDFANARELQTRIVELESLMSLVSGGSPNAVTLGFLKAILHEGGIISHLGLTAPLRELSIEDREEMVKAVRALGRLESGNSTRAAAS